MNLRARKACGSLYVFYYRYLLDRMKQMEEEKSMAMATASKYKVNALSHPYRLL